MNMPVSVIIMAKIGIYRQNISVLASINQGCYFCLFHQISIYLTPALFYCSPLATQHS